MKYADGPTTSVATNIAASPAAVWALVTNIALPARFSSELQAVEWMDEDTQPALGARFAGRNRHQAVGEWETACVVTAFEAERCFEWSVGDPEQPAAVWRFTIADEGDQVRLEQWCQLGPGWSGLSVAIEAMPDKEERIIERRLEEHRANMEANLAGIKQLAEDSSA